MEPRRKILFVEDDSVDCMAIERFFKKEDPGFDWVIAKSFMEAIENINSGDYDLIISDYQLGDGTAFDFFGLIGDAPLIFMTGLGDQATAVKAMKSGAYDYIIKDNMGKHLITVPIIAEKAIKRKQEEKELVKYRERLEELVKTRTIELENEILTRKKVEEEILELNAGLEERVKQRTQLLEQALEEIEFENEERKKVQMALEDSNFELKRLNDALANESKKLIILNDKLAKSQDDMKAANDTKDKFFSIIAHDLKNPLQVLVFSSELLWKYYESSDQINMSKHIDRIRKTSINLKDLLENLLTWSRSQRGFIAHNPKNFDLSDLVESVIEFFKETAEKKKISIISSIPKKSFIYSDIDIISVILRNLIGNSLKFTNEGGHISCGIEYYNDKAVVAVTDNGIGIVAADLPKLFRMDSHHTTSGTEDEKGTGLGLILCKELVEKQNGMIWAESEPGKGSTFKFSTPVI